MSTKQACVPCSSLDPSALLSLDNVKSHLETTLKLWTLESLPSKDSVTNDKDDQTSSTSWMLSRQFVAKNFQAALDAINAMGVIAEAQNHHPDFHLTNYRHVQIDVYTHKLNGITENDISLAALLDQGVSVAYSPKWLKEHPEASFTAKQ